ncbi:MAG: hypothetical protein IJ904_07680 [Candidatus Methanomethylophilaceae archaeon]|nr:hypothetical protein [Candidatus Methanomethylophilaceae archaeon]
MNAYKYTGGPFGESVRTWNRWILVVNGEETRFDRKKHALLCAAASKARGLHTELFQETVMRFRRGGEIHDEVFRIDISNRLR